MKGDAMGSVFFGGVPTKIDVQKLDDKYGVPEPGALITHDDIAACIGHPWRSDRYTTVLDAWRARLRREFNTDTTVEPGKGLYVLTPPERITVGKKDARRGMRVMKRGASRVAAAPDAGLTDDQRVERDRASAVLFRLHSVASREFKALEPPKMPEPMPRVLPA